MKLQLKQDKQKYLSLANQHALPLFFQKKWLNLITGDQWEGWIIEQENQETVGLMSLPYQKKLGKRVYRNPIFHPYSGPFFFTPQNNTLLSQREVWEGLYTQSRAHQFWMHLHGYPDFNLSKGFDSSHSSIFTIRDTYFLDLSQQEEDLFHQIRPRRRSYIRKMNLKHSIQSITHPEWKTWLEWLTHSFSRKNAIMPYEANLLNEVFELLEATENHLFLSVVDAQEQIKAVLWIMFDEERAYQMWSAFDPLHSEHGVMEFLVWEGVREMKKRGKQIYDFEGSMEPGIARFFQQMGGVKTHYLNIQPTPHYIVQLAQRILK